MWHRMILSDKDDSARGIYEAMNWSANRVIVPAGLVVLVSGVAMVASRAVWGFDQLWVFLALVLFAVSAFGFGTWIDRLFANALELLGDKGASGPRYRAAAHKLIRVARIDGFVMVSILGIDGLQAWAVGGCSHCETSCELLAFIRLVPRRGRGSEVEEADHRGSVLVGHGNFDTDGSR
jgi:hypothetical protein